MTDPLEFSPANYSIEAELAHHEWFTLYQARRRSDDSLVLLKRMAPVLASDELFVIRLRQIIRQVSSLDHPHIIPTYEVEQEDDHLFVAQKFVRGPSLAQVIEREGPLSPRRTQHLIQQLASALDYAHQKSISHGDLSADQIFLGPDDHLWLANFGQSQIFFGSRLASYPCAISRPETIAPERVRGQGPSRPADLYALGVAAYHMLAKRPPFTGPPSTVLHAQAYKQPPALHEVNPAIGLALSEAISRMLSKGVELRYNTGAEFARALQMAPHRRPDRRRYERLLPLTEREQPRTHPFKTLFYLSAALMLLLFVTGLSVWAGYELGLRQTGQPPASPTQLTIHTTLPTPSPRPNLVVEVGSSPTLPLTRTARPLPTFTPAMARVSLSDSLLPASSPTPAPTLTPSPQPVSRPPAPTPTPSRPALPASQGLFFFFNPTGHDLVVDLSGPHTESATVPPGQRRQFLLPPGAYQYIAHPLANNELITVVGYFELIPGHQLERDYYSDYDWTRQ